MKRFFSLMLSLCFAQWAVFAADPPASAAEKAAAEAEAKTRSAFKDALPPGLRTRGPGPSPAPAVAPLTRSGFRPRGPRPVFLTEAEAAARKEQALPLDPGTLIPGQKSPASIAPMQKVEIKVNASHQIDFADILFTFNSAKFADAESAARVRGIAAALRDLPPGHRFAIEGHTCDLGADDYNDRLSWLRAAAVCAALHAAGVPADRLEPIGFGESLPAVTLPPLPADAQEALRTQNRRVGIRLLVPNHAP